MYYVPVYAPQYDRNPDGQHHGDQRFWGFGFGVPFLTGLVVGPLLYNAFRPNYYPYPYPPYQYYQQPYYQQPSPYYQENIYYVNPSGQQPYGPYQGGSNQ